LAGADGGSRVPTINVKNIDGSPPWKVVSKIWERPSSMLRNIDDGPLGGVRARDLGTPTINAKKYRR
jgi:hypothetical protein